MTYATVFYMVTVIGASIPTKVVIIMTEFWSDKVKYLREPWRLRVHLAYLLVILFSLFSNPSYPLLEIGAGMVVAGLLIRAWSSGIVKKDEELAVEGPYSLVRNPLYVGNFFIGYGFCFVQGAWWSFVLISVYFVLIYPFTIQKEEQKLSRYFPDEYEDYCRNVGRFIPRITPYSRLGGWKPNQYFVANKDWLNEGFALLFLLFPLYNYLIT